MNVHPSIGNEYTICGFVLVCVNVADFGNMDIVGCQRVSNIIVVLSEQWEAIEQLKFKFN